MQASEAPAEVRQVEVTAEKGQLYATCPLQNGRPYQLGTKRTWAEAATLEQLKLGSKNPWGRRNGTNHG